MDRISPPQPPLLPLPSREGVGQEVRAPPVRQGLTPPLDDRGMDLKR